MANLHLCRCDGVLAFPVSKDVFKLRLIIDIQQSDVVSILTASKKVALVHYLIIAIKHTALMAVRTVCLVYPYHNDDCDFGRY